MTLSSIHSYAVIGVTAEPIHIEVHIANGLPGLSIVGLPEAAVRESKDRVRSAILNSGFDYPARRITVNLAPAGIPKYGAGFDLPIAIGILHASDQLKIPQQAPSQTSPLNDYAFVGELSLSGELRPVSGALPIAVKSLKDNKQLLLPAQNLDEVRILNNSGYRYADSLLRLCTHLSGEQPLPLAANTEVRVADTELCLSDIQGQAQAKRALEIAAAGCHSMLMQGPPGTGKTMLASRMQGILPSLTVEQAIEVASIYSVAQIPRHAIQSAPYRAPHHTASAVALVGGGSRPIPGEISLAHRGVLFLDELPEFPNKVLEVMRQPLESGEIWISRASLKTIFPANFQLIAAMNACPCGYLGEARCQCTPDRVNRYQSKISGPLLDRIDMQIYLSRPKAPLSFDKSQADSSASVRKRVLNARRLQQQRQGCCNSQLPPASIDEMLRTDADLSNLAHLALDRMQLSLRALHRSMRVALSIADLQHADLDCQHLTEALSYRQQLKQ